MQTNIKKFAQSGQYELFKNIFLLPWTPIQVLSFCSSMPPLTPLRHRIACASSTTVRGLKSRRGIRQKAFVWFLAKREDY
jgi:hypothetical protein